MVSASIKMAYVFKVVREVKRLIQSIVKFGA